MVLGVLGLVYLSTAFALDRYGRRGVQGRWDVIMVAGCRVMADGRPSPALEARVRRAVELYDEGRAPLIVMTGGVGDNAPSEARASMRLAVSLGVPADAIVLEERSTSTDENARFARDALQESEVDVGRTLVVTSAYHVLRCERVFARYLPEVRGVGVVEEPWPRVRGALREVVALTAYGVLGRL